MMRESSFPPYQFAPCKCFVVGGGGGGGLELIVVGGGGGGLELKRKQCDLSVPATDGKLGRKFSAG